MREGEDEGGRGRMREGRGDEVIVTTDTGRKST